MKIEIELIFLIPLILVTLKSLIIGSEFSFHYWIRDGRKYLNWYNQRDKYEDE